MLTDQTEVLRMIEHRNAEEEARWRPIFRTIGFGRVIQMAGKFWCEMLGTEHMQGRGVLPDEFRTIMRRVREEKGLSLRDVADRTGISHAHVRYLESGERNPTLDTFLAVCHGLEVDPSEVIRSIRVPARLPR